MSFYLTRIASASPGLINPASAEESRSIHASFLPEGKMFEPSG